METTLNDKTNEKSVGKSPKNNLFFQPKSQINRQTPYFGVTLLFGNGNVNFRTSFLVMTSSTQLVPFCATSHIYVGCSESSCNCVITLLIFIYCTGKLVCVNFHLFLIVDRKIKEK